MLLPPISVILLHIIALLSNCKQTLSKSENQSHSAFTICSSTSKLSFSASAVNKSTSTNYFRAFDQTHSTFIKHYQCHNYQSFSTSVVCFSMFALFYSTFTKPFSTSTFCFDTCTLCISASTKLKK